MFQLTRFKKKSLLRFFVMATVFVTSANFLPQLAKATADSPSTTSSSAPPSPTPLPPSTTSEQPTNNPYGWTDAQLQGYACLVGGGIAMTIIALVGPTEVGLIMGGAEFIWSPSMPVVWTAVVANAGAVTCAMAGVAAPAIVHVWRSAAGLVTTPVSNP